VKDHPFIKFTLLFIIGVLARNFFICSSLQYLILIFLLGIVYFSFKLFVKNKSRSSLPNTSAKLILNIISSFIFFLAGVFIAQINKVEINSVLDKYYKEKNVKLYAEVLNVELKKTYEIAFTIEIDSIFIDGKTLRNPEKLICKFRGNSVQQKYLYQKLNAGNKIYLTGTFQKGRGKRNPGEFDYDKYLKSKGISGLFVSYETDSVKIISDDKDYFKSFLHSIRKSIDQTIHDLHNEQTAGLLRGLLLADRSEIDYETKIEFINSGVVHILAVSGLNIGYILIIFLIIFGRFGIYLRSIFTLTGLFLFLFIIGIQPSVFRATLMAAIIIIAFLTNRSTNVINSISLAAVIILIFNPDDIYDPGFQLSFAAVLAMVLLYPFFQKIIYRLKLKSKLVENVLLFFCVSLSAQIGTLPFTLAYFSKLSIIALLANLIVIPLSGLILALGFITVALGVISTAAAGYFAAANNLFSYLMMEFIRHTGRLEFSFLWIRNYSLYDALVFYFFLGFLFFALKQISKPILVFFILIISTMSIFIFSSFDDKELLEKNKLSVLMIDVGQGDSFLIKFPNGKTALIDAGEANQFIDNGERIIIPLLDYLGIDKIDYGFISHLDMDHYGGFISLIQNDRIKEIFRPLPDSSKKSLRLEKFLIDKKIKTDFYNKTSLQIGNTKVYILNEPFSAVYSSFSSNDKSGILKIVYDEISFLFVGDCEFPGEYFLANNFRNMLDSDVLKVGHHGSPSGSSKTFLDLVTPKISLVSAGIKNKFSHPSERVINSLKNVNSKIYRTDLIGAVLLQSDGKKIQAINWK